MHVFSLLCHLPTCKYSSLFKKVGARQKLNSKLIRFIRTNITGILSSIEKNMQSTLIEWLKERPRTKYFCFSILFILSKIGEIVFLHGIESHISYKNVEFKKKSLIWQRVVVFALSLTSATTCYEIEFIFLRLYSFTVF